MTHSAIILARGLGTRMRADDGGAILTAEQRQAADAGHKALMPIAGRPFLDYVLGAAADAGIDRIGLVVAPDHDIWRDYYRNVRPPSRIAIDFIVQAQALGTADAVRSAEAWTGGEPFLAMNADNLYPADVLRALAALPEPGLAAFDAAELVASGNIEAARVAAFALVEQDAAGYLTAIVEKPAADDATRLLTTRRVSMNCWRFDARIHAACRDVPPSARGELELPEAVGLAVSRGVRFKVLEARGAVLDLSRRGDADAVARRLAGTSPRL